MSVIESIRKRKSVRTYTGEPLRKEDSEAIKQYICGLAQPLGGRARIELLSTQTGTEPVKLGTYGIISGARDFLVLVYEEGTLAPQNAGYLFEQVVLFCTERGLGTCWLGGTLKKSDFASQVGLKENEQLTIVSPVGYPKEKKRMLERIMRAGAGSDNRKPFGSMFFSGDFGVSLDENTAGKFHQPLEMVRIAPSASNTQPWRVIVDSSGVHFYYEEKSRFSPIDLGIALCHFGESCREMKIPGHFTQLDNTPTPGNGTTYVTSWVAQ